MYIKLALLLQVGVALGLDHAYFKDLQRPWVETYNNHNPEGDTYSWGYRYPSQYHVESKLSGGNVVGSFGFNDANGDPVQKNYVSDTINGFRVEDTPGEVHPPSNVPQSIQEPLPLLKSAFALRPIKDIGITNRVIPAGVLLKSASHFSQPPAPSGNVLLRTLDPNTPILKSGNGGYLGHFLVSPEDIREAGGVSAAAVKFGSAPVAAVHDAKVPRYH